MGQMSQDRPTHGTKAGWTVNEWHGRIRNWRFPARPQSASSYQLLVRQLLRNKKMDTKLAATQGSAQPSAGVNDRPADPQWECQYGLPIRPYLDFVGDVLLQTPGQNDLDPFSVNLPRRLAEHTYVLRESVVAEVFRRGTRVILGKAGIGKSALYAALLRQIGRSTLVVGLPLHEIIVGSSGPSVLTGEASLLSPPLLVPRIFEAYWTKTILDDRQRSNYVSQLRVDKQWMALLRWFYQHYPPSHPKVDDHELMAWLTAPSNPEPLRPDLPPLIALREMIRMACWQADPGLFFGPRAFRRAYSDVEVLLDGTEQLSPPAIGRLVEDTQGLYGSGLDRFHFKLFMDDAWESQVLQTECVRQGRVNVVSLPDWSEAELRRLLRVRIFSLREGSTSEDYQELPEYGLGDLLASAESLLPETRDQLEIHIIKGAQGNPLHALRIARCVVAAACGCWSSYPPPLSLDSVKRLIDAYQKHTGVSKRNSAPADHEHLEEK